MSSRSKLFHEITSFDKTAFGLATGLRSAIFLTLPLFIGLATGYPEAVYIALGAVFLFNTEGQRSTVPSWILLLACLTESTAWALGTLAGTTGIFAPALIGTGVFVTALARFDPKWGPVATFTAISFAVGAGLPGGSSSAAVQRFYLTLVGALIALVGVELHRLLTSRRKSRDIKNRVTIRNPTNPIHWSDVILNAAALGIASALGFGIALSLGLPRDFWVVVTILLTFRPTVSLTVSFTSMMVIGTIVGAAIGAAIVLEVSNLYVLSVLLFIFSVLMFATRGVNLGLVQLFFTPFIIVLLNIVFPAGLEFAEGRILDVALGGIISIVAVYVVGLRNRAEGISG